MANPIIGQELIPVLSNLIKMKKMKKAMKQLFFINFMQKNTTRQGHHA